MKNRLVNMAILVSTVILLSVLAFYVRIETIADSVAVFKTTGMTCTSCSIKISKALELLKGVAVTEVDVKGGWVVVGYDTKIVNPDALVVQINSAGYSSNLNMVLTPDQFKQITGRAISSKTSQSSGRCGSKDGGCGSNKES